MTVKELRDRLDAWIKRDPPDIWMLNDIQADAKAYQERCKARENAEVVVLDDGMKARHFAVEASFGKPMSKKIDNGYLEEDAYALLVDMTKELD